MAQDILTFHLRFGKVVIDGENWTIYQNEWTFDEEIKFHFYPWDEVFRFIQLILEARKNDPK